MAGQVTRALSASGDGELSTDKADRNAGPIRVTNNSVVVEATQ
jgi:hypothetical protein